MLDSPRKIYKSGDTMPEKKTDARVRYTELMIRNSFVALLKEKSLAKVTVTDICSLAGINRATFYAHYKDPSDLMKSLENELLENIVVILSRCIDADVSDLRRILPEILSYIRSEADICLVLMSDLTDTGFVKRCLCILETSFVERYTELSGISPELANQLFLYGAMGSVGLLHRWLTSGCNQGPEYMSELIISLFNNGASAFNVEQK